MPSVSRVLLPLVILLASCPKEKVATAPVDLADTSPQAIEAAITSTLDAKTDPCDDFYQYACGGWLESNTIPAERSTWGRGFSTILERNETLVKGLLDSNVSSDPRLGAYWESCNDTTSVEKEGIAPLKPFMNTIAEVKDAGSLMEAIAKLPLSSPFFDAGADADFENPSLTILHIAQGGMGLPEPGYYTPTDDAGKKMLAEYEAHVGRMLGFIGVDASLASKVVGIETRLAAASLSPEELRSPEKIYHRIERAGLQQLTPDLPWDRLFNELGYPGLVQINVMTPDFFPAFNAVVKEGDWGSIRAYLLWHLVKGAAPYLPAKVEEESFNFYGKTLMGAQQQRPRWKRCVEEADGALGDLLGKAYVDRAFPGDSKPKALQMIKDIEAAFEQNLPGLNWMDDATRAAALEKLHTITNKIGYPDKWETYQNLEIGDSLFQNAVNVYRWNLKDQLAKVGGPVDKSEWGMSPPTVNAYYNPLNNEIVFPAGILQPPFFAAGYPAAMNYGAMGMVMGHEVTHGFDDEGRKFAPDGSLREWWRQEAIDKFEKRAQCVVDLYETFEPLPGQHINGNLTLGENIADLGGIKLASTALGLYQSRTGDKAGAAGFSPEQLLFIGYAQSWCTLQRDETVKVRLATDPHSAPKFRVNGPLSQLPAFHEAFQCKQGEPMHPEKVCEVW
jgi:putative endopeptidase